MACRVPRNTPSRFVHEPPPVSKVQCSDRLGERYASAVDADVQTGPVGQNSGRCHLPVSFRGHIEPEGDGMTAAGADLVRGLCQLRFVHVGQSDPCPFLCKPLSGGLANAGGYARHQGDFPDHAWGAEPVCHASGMPRNRVHGESALFLGTSADSIVMSTIASVPSEPGSVYIRSITPI